MLLKVFAAVVIGGSVIGGGKGGAVGGVIGAFILTVGQHLLVLGIRTYYVPIVEGVVLIAAVLALPLATCRFGGRWLDSGRQAVVTITGLPC